MKSFRSVDPRRWIVVLVTCAATCSIVVPSYGGEPFRFRSRRVAETRFAPRTVVQGSEFLGTFEPTPYVFVRGNGTTGGGYSPLQVAGDQTMVMYGPLSVMRSATAPVTTYVRGYDGALQPVSGISFSTPNLSTLSPVVYPNRSSDYYHPRTDVSPPAWPKDGMNWIDQN
jgi:hypothetical protein